MNKIIRANAFYRPTASANLLLDLYPNAAAAYSLRKLKSSYSGSAIRIRRDSTGNAETDIGFTANGDLDTTAIKNHCRNNSCMITTWYNQGDSTSVNFTQTTAASQPRIMTSGVIERRAGNPTIRFDVSGTSDFMDVTSSTAKFSFLHKTGQAALFFIGQAGLVDNPNVLYIFLDNNQGASQTQTGITFLYDDRSSLPTNNTMASVVTRGVNTTEVSRNVQTDYITPNQLNLITNFLDNNNSTASDRNIIYYNGGNQLKLNTQTSTPSTGNASQNLRMGRLANSTLFPLNGFVSELIIYSTDQSSNRTGIESNINNYYGIW